MHRFLIAYVFLLTSPAVASAAFTDFGDLTLATTYPAGSSIVSNGIALDVVKFPSTGYGTPIRVGNYGSAGGDGLELSLPNTIGVEFQLPRGAEEISLDYGAYCCHEAIVVNGVASIPGQDFSDVAGAMIGGASVSVVSTGTSGGSQGRITITGPIVSFAIGGTEFAIDNVRVVVPEPGAMGLLLMAAPIAVRRRQRSHPA
ncbi:hypothetical protein Mal64_33650 [Pseudobythopirellula maris]|uniref:PEP-CTERM protein-sorting domain-containing protein n=1 Tax=Pseudobythopirellula maris TaxID=2527991 RepID=A0A5C5ZGJ4_9BACT|nr:hypothetical protein [Pseudobythopirellula maris]TWT86539.1 hypothetical protein Mal64_33650 [Pseudobythopirellula maris]